MQLATVEPAENNIGIKSTALTMKATAAAYKILSTSMYSDKPKAVLRELAANGLDAHVGYNDSTPISIKLPTELDPTLVVTDYGRGMSLSTINSVYNQWFNSTKTDSNEEVGGFGIGSKAPYSISDSFTVVTTNEGVTTTLVMSQCADGPVCTVLSSTYTGAPSGTEVTVPVDKESTRIRLRDVSKTLFKYWKVQPVINTVEQDTPKKSNVCGFSVFTERKSYYDDIFTKVLVGPYVYDIPDSLQEQLNSKVKNQVQLATQLGDAVGLILATSIGDLELAPSRERIEDTDANMELLRKTIGTTVDSMLAEYNQHMEDVLYAVDKWLAKYTEVPYDGLPYKDVEHFKALLLRMFGSEAVVEQYLKVVLFYEYTSKECDNIKLKLLKKLRAHSAYAIQEIVYTYTYTINSLTQYRSVSLGEVNGKLRRSEVYNPWRNLKGNPPTVILAEGLTTQQKAKINYTLLTNGEVPNSNSVKGFTVDNYIEVNTDDKTRLVYLLNTVMNLDANIITYSDIEDVLLDLPKRTYIKVGKGKKVIAGADKILDESAVTYNPKSIREYTRLSVKALYYSDTYKDMNVVLDVRNVNDTHVRVKEYADKYCRTEQTLVVALSLKESRTERFKTLVKRKNVKVFTVGGEEPVMQYFLGKDLLPLKICRTILYDLHIEDIGYFTDTQQVLINKYCGVSAVRGYYELGLSLYNYGVQGSYSYNLFKILDDSACMANAVCNIVPKTKIKNLIKEVSIHLKEKGNVPAY